MQLNKHPDLSDEIVSFSSASMFNSGFILGEVFVIAAYSHFLETKMHTITLKS